MQEAFHETPRIFVWVWCLSASIRVCTNRPEMAEVGKRLRECCMPAPKIDRVSTPAEEVLKDVELVWSNCR